MLREVLSTLATVSIGGDLFCVEYASMYSQTWTPQWQEEIPGGSIKFWTAIAEPWTVGKYGSGDKVSQSDSRGAI